MKNLILSLLTLLFVPAVAQDNITLCHTPATESFALFASNEDFNADHPTPLPYVHQSEVGKMITFPTSGEDANAYLLKAKVNTDSYLFVIHEWWGLNDHIKREANKLYDDLGGLVNVIALDLYDGKTATTREKASELMSSVDSERAQTIIKGALDFGGSGAEVMTIGWCFGGGWSLQMAIMAGDALKGCVMYYGMPEKDVNRLKALNAPVLGIFAKQDGWITPEVVDNFKANMAKAGETLTVKMYDAKHAFANPSNPEYDKAATEDAYKAVMAFIKPKLD